MFKKFATSAVIAVSILSAASAASAASGPTIKKSWSGAWVPYFAPSAAGTGTVAKWSNGTLSAHASVTGLPVGDYNLIYHNWSRGGEINDSVTVCKFHVADPTFVSGCGTQVYGINKVMSQGLQIQIPGTDSRGVMATTRLQLDK